MSQPRLPLATPSRPSKSERDQHALEAFLVQLEARRDWMKAAELTHLGNERYLRLLANLPEGHILSGPQGYKLTKLCTVEEGKVINRWKSQAEAMLSRVVKTLKVLHGGK